MPWFLALLLCVLPLSAPIALADDANGGAGDGGQVDVAIVVSYDRSESIDRAEANAQIQGLIYTLRHKRFHMAVSSGYFRRIALSAIAWSSFNRHELIMPWMQISNPKDARMAAIWLEKFRDRGDVAPYGTQTDVAHGIKLATEQMHTLPWWASKKVINMVGDGVSNIGRIASIARDETLAAGITINGLVMVRGKAVRPLSAYYRREVIGGPTAFLQLSHSNEDFAEAMLRKMTLEMVRLRGQGAREAREEG
ncbi:MAG: DUF1194 domain-containing protein [Alphaproteobacteria bacterium]|jgi:hypothetical protein|nr:DUF1194 domain-containing protein [Alphaproteobacteria bacterium]